LCRAFGWLPSQLDDEDEITISRYHAFYNADLEHENNERKKAQEAARRKK